MLIGLTTSPNESTLRATNVKRVYIMFEFCGELELDMND
jgi:hypothetical protein